MSQVQVITNYWCLQNSFSIGVTDTVADVATMKEIEDTINQAKLQVHDLVRQGQSTSVGTSWAPNRGASSRTRTCAA